MRPAGRDKFVDRRDEPWFEKIELRAGDVVVSLVQPSAYVAKAGDHPGVAGPNVAVLRTKDNEYVGTYLNTPDGRRLFEEQTDRHARGATVRHLTVRDLAAIRIPILPLSDLNSVSDDSIAAASGEELEALRQELVAVKRKLEFTEAALAQARDRNPHERFVEEQLAKIAEQQRVTNVRLDEIGRALAAVRDGVEAIKSSSRDDEEKLARIYAKLDAVAASVQRDASRVAEYSLVVRRWLDRWELLEDLSQTFLVSAEHLYDVLAGQPDVDFSPFIIQYCRALENEILAKMFSAYHDDVRDRHSDLQTLVAADLGADKTKRFAVSVLRDQRLYTLGEMDWILRLTKAGGATLASSPLLRDFRGFVLRYFDERITEDEYLRQVTAVNEELRRKAAHPYLLDKTLADRCLHLVRMAISELLDCYRRVA